MACNITCCFLLVFVFAFLSRIPSGNQKEETSPNHPELYHIQVPYEYKITSCSCAKTLAASVRETLQHADVSGVMLTSQGPWPWPWPGCLRAGSSSTLLSQTRPFPGRVAREALLAQAPRGRARSSTPRRGRQSLRRSSSASSSSRGLNHFNEGNEDDRCRQAERAHVELRHHLPRANPSPIPTEIKKSQNSTSTAF